MMPRPGTTPLYNRLGGVVGGIGSMAYPAKRPPKDAKVPNSANKSVPLINVQSYTGLRQIAAQTYDKKILTPQPSAMRTA